MIDNFDVSLNDSLSDAELVRNGLISAKEGLTSKLDVFMQKQGLHGPRHNQQLSIKFSLFNLKQSLFESNHLRRFLLSAVSHKIDQGIAVLLCLAFVPFIHSL